MSHVYDVLILGGGPAGLSMATALARQAYTALVIDSGVYRNARARNMHNVPGFDHVPPAEYRAKVRRDLEARYKSIEFRETTIVEVRQRNASSSSSTMPELKDAAGGSSVDNGTAVAHALADAKFEAKDNEGNVFYGRKIGIATGVRDKVEDEVEGYAECWARGIFHCLFCDGYEQRGGASVGVLAVGLGSTAPAAMHVALLAKRLSQHTTIYTNGDGALASTLAAQIGSSKITLEPRRITRLAMKNYPAETTVVVTLEDGATREEAFVSSHPMLAQASPFAAQLGLEVKDEMGGPLIVLKTPLGETSVAGCFAGGDAAMPMKSVVGAVQTGLLAGVGACMQMMEELAGRDEL